MTKQEQLIEIHNLLCEIYVKGDDTIKMGNCLINLRKIITQMNEEAVAEDVNT